MDVIATAKADSYSLQSLVESAAKPRSWVGESPGFGGESDIKARLEEFGRW